MFPVASSLIVDFQIAEGQLTMAPFWWVLLVSSGMHWRAVLIMKWSSSPPNDVPAVTPSCLILNSMMWMNMATGKRTSSAPVKVPQEETDPPPPGFTTDPIFNTSSLLESSTCAQQLGIMWNLSNLIYLITYMQWDGFLNLWNVGFHCSSSLHSRWSTYFVLLFLINAFLME